MLLSIAKPRLERVVRTRQDPCADERAPDVASNTIALMGESIYFNQAQFHRVG